MKVRFTLLGLAFASLSVSAQGGQQPEQLPRYRAGANLVHVDAYFTKDGAPVQDLKVDDVEVLEDDRPQQIENFEFIAPRPAGSPSMPAEPTTVAEMREQAAGAARLFTVFLDSNHVTIEGAYHANKPLVDTLDKLIGPDDMFGVMTPDMTPGNITYGRRTGSLERYLKETWDWGQRGRMTYRDTHEQDIANCYPDSQPEYKGIAANMIARLREQKTLDALDQLVTHLDGLRPERKFVMVFTEGWPLFRRDENLGRPLSTQGGDMVVPGVDPVRTGGDGKLTTKPDPRLGQGTGFDACERERVMLAFIDHQIQFRETLQRANRANVSFYPIDARGLIVFDSPISAPLPPALDRAVLNNRWDNLRQMAAQTDGVAILDQTNFGPVMQRMFADVGSYYLLRYYSSNPKLDGRFRRITVNVKRPGVDVRARAGYLAPTEAEARAAGANIPVTTANRGGVIIGRPSAAPPPPAAPPEVTRALDMIAPARGNLPVRIQAAGGPGFVRAVVELDPVTQKQPEWLSGGDLHLSIEPERGGGKGFTVDAALAPGQRSVVATTSADTAIPPGRYQARAELKAKGARSPVQVTTFVTVPGDTAKVGSAVLASRRGPSTGLAYVATADPRFRRTERLRLELPLMADGFNVKEQMLTKEGQPMQLIVNYTTRVDEERKVTIGLAEVVLAPLAEGEYVFEVTLEKDGKSDVLSYGFRIIP